MSNTAEAEIYQLDLLLITPLQDGLLTCDPEDMDNVLPEQRLDQATQRYEPVLTTVEDILAHFKHDQTPALKGSLL